MAADGPKVLQEQELERKSEWEMEMGNVYVATTGQNEQTSTGQVLDRDEQYWTSIADYRRKQRKQSKWRNLRK